MIIIILINNNRNKNEKDFQIEKKKLSSYLMIHDNGKGEWN
jgi:hypothetical protein